MIAYFTDDQLIINRDTFISSKFDMYCGGCENIPFWRWLKGNQLFSLSVTCNDYGGEYLYNLQPNNVTDCFGEYLCTWFERVIKCIANTLKISTCFFYENDLSPFMKPLLCSLIYYIFICICID